MDYQINDKVVHSTGGVFIINEIKVMNYGGTDIKYFCLKPYFIDNQNKTLVVYVPEGKANELLRPVISKEEAEDLLETMRTSEPIWYSDVKERKEKFSILYHSGNLKDVCIIIKSLFSQQQKLSANNKSLNLLDYDYLNKLKKGIEEELAVVLGLQVSEVETHILKIVNG